MLLLLLFNRRRQRTKSIRRANNEALRSTAHLRILLVMNAGINSRRLIMTPSGTVLCQAAASKEVNSVTYAHSDLHKEINDCHHTNVTTASSSIQINVPKCCNQYCLFLG